MPRVSVIIPNYNHARFLERRISSVLEQTFQDFELLLLDDASTDDSLEIIERYRSDSRVQIIVNERNSGSPFPQWNKGVSLASSELVWIAEADDDADHRLLGRLVAAYDEHPSTVLACAQSLVTDEYDVVVGDMKDWTRDLDPIRWNNDFVSDGRLETARCLMVKNTIPNASAVLFRRAAYNKAGGASEDMRLCGDWLLWAKLLQHGGFVWLAEPLNRFRKHGGTVRATIQRQRYFDESLRVIETLAKTFPIPDKAFAMLQENWWLAVHHSQEPIEWSWMREQACRSADLSWKLALQLMVKGLAAKVLHTPPGRLLLAYKNAHSG